MSYIRSEQVQNHRPAVNTRGPEEAVIPFSVSLSAALVLNDVIGLCRIPPRHKVTDCFISVSDLDTDGSPAIILDAGVWEDDSETAPTVVDADAVVDGSAAGQAGGIISGPNAEAFLDLASSDSERIFGLLVQVAPTAGATSGTVKGYLRVRGIGYDD